VLTKQLQAQEDKVRDAQSELDRLRKELGLSDMDASGTAPAAMVDADTLRRFETMRIEGEVQLAGQQAQLDQFLGMTNQKLREVLPSVVPDAALHELLSQLNVTELALARLRADTGPNHPETVKTAGQVKLLNQKLDDRITGIMTGLTNQMAVARVKLEKLHESVAEARAKESDRSRGSRAYYDKKQEVEELIRFSSILSMKLATERVDAQLPKSALAEIVDRASPGLKPVRPNKPLNLAIGAAGGCFMALLVGCAAALIVSLKRKGPAGPTTAVA
jgi:uncharacterized protein involved in exopolysaccharide biosynthesis